MTDDVGKPDSRHATIDFLPDDTTNGTGQEVDSVSSLTDACFFGYSIRGDFAKVAAIEAQANFLQNAPGSERFILPNNGPINNLPGSEEKSEEEKRLDQLREAVAFADEVRERQREEWAKTESTFAGLTMTGAEWSDFSDDLKQDSPLRRWLIEKMKRDGKTTAQAESMADKLSELLHIQSIPKEQRTAEQQLMLDQANRDKETNQYLEATSKQRDMMSTTRSSSVENISKAETAVSITSRADELSNFATAPDLTASYNIALASKPVTETASRIAAPEKPTSPTVQSSGFDV